jgi:acetyl esterase/lipase
MRYFILICFVVVTASPRTSAQKLADPILLWPQGAPGATGSTNEDKPALIPFVPDASKRNGAVVLVVPGGGFTIRAIDHEGVLVAQWLKERGITAFVLRYRLRPIYSRTDWIRDGQRAIQYIRAHAAEYHISPDRVGAAGFSAGANLIADMSLHAIPGKADATDPLDRVHSKPDFMILAYGAMQIPPDVDSATIAKLPPTFLYGTEEDAVSLRGMVDFHAKIFKAGVPAEAHFFQNGIHGSGFAIGDPILGEWPKLMHNWMAVGGFLTDKSQIGFTGIANLDGTPLVKGMIIFTPVENPGAPPVVVYMNNTGTGGLGRFTVAPERGPVAGKYRVEVRQDATRWTSNSRDPFMIKMMAKQRDGTLTEQDNKEWSEFLRKRDLSPSIENQRIFFRQRPNDKQDYVVELKPDDDVVIEVFSK